jgi:DNA polymerase-4
MNRWPHIVVHADMDAFYAAVEQLDDPALRGRPVLVGPNSHRGVVLTASYEARPYRVGSAMPIAVARRRCPDAVIVPPRFERYEAISRQVMEVFQDFSPAVEPLSLDEAFLDMTGAEHLFGPPATMGRRIRAAVRDAVGLSVSAGISGTKYVAKVASAYDKPDGLTVVPPEDAIGWLAPQPVERLWGVGSKTATRLRARGFESIGDIAAAGEVKLFRMFGSLGIRIYQLSQAQDPRRVERRRIAKSIGCDRTLETDVSRREDIERHLRRAAERIAQRVRAKGLLARGVRVRLKTTSFDLLTRQRHLPQPADTAAVFLRTACGLLNEFDDPGPFRLVGMAVFDLEPAAASSSQYSLFTGGDRRKLETTIDRLTSRFGAGTVVRAKDLESADTVADRGVNLDFLEEPN